ncbi:zf-C3Hc3H domain-containing protein [Balamuthia mandrillaris]
MHYYSNPGSEAEPEFVEAEGTEEEEVSRPFTSRRENFSSLSPALVYRKRYRALKRKFTSLEEENAELAAELFKAKRLLCRLHKQKGILLDKLLEYERPEDASSDTETSPNSGDDQEGSEEESTLPPFRPIASSASTVASNAFVKPKAPRKPKRTRTEHSSPTATASSLDSSESVSLCVAVVKDRPCKSKSLSGYKYCWHHAPLDPNSPFIWCQYLDPSKKNKQCSIPVAKSKGQPFCKYHSKPEDSILSEDDTNESESLSEHATKLTKKKEQRKEEGSLPPKKDNCQDEEVDIEF